MDYHSRSLIDRLWLGFILVGLLAWTGCSTPKEPTVTIQDKLGEKLISYTAPESPDDPILGCTDGGLWLVREELVKDAILDKAKIKQLEGRIREMELDGGN